MLNENSEPVSSLGLSDLGVWMSAYNETDWTRSTFTENSVSLTKCSMTKTDRVHLQNLISTTAHTENRV